jgi:hypothetical protein
MNAPASGWSRLSLRIGGFVRDSELTRPAAGQRMGHSDHIQHFRGGTKTRRRHSLRVDVGGA